MTDATTRREVDAWTRAKWDERFRGAEWTLLPNPALKPRHQNAMDEVLLDEMAAGRRGPHLRWLRGHHAGAGVPALPGHDRATAGSCRCSPLVPEWSNCSTMR